MRAPRAGRWGQERKELGGGLGRGAEEERREAGLLRTSSIPSPTLTHHPNVHSSGDVYTCKEEQVPSLTLVPGCKGFQSSGTPGCLRPPPAEPLHSPQFSLHFVAGFTGLVSTEGRGAIALCILEKVLGKGGGPQFTPCPSPSAPPQPSPHGSVFLSNCAS